MATGTYFDDYANQLGRSTHDLATDELKLALSNTAPDTALDTVFADITEIAAGNGYTAGGFTLANKTYDATSGVVTIDGDDLQMDALGGDVGPFRYVFLYNNTPTTPLKPLIRSFDIGEMVTVLAGTAYQIRLDAGGILAIAPQTIV